MGELVRKWVSNKVANLMVEGDYGTRNTSDIHCKCVRFQGKCELEFTVLIYQTSSVH